MYRWNSHKRRSKALSSFLKYKSLKNTEIGTVNTRRYTSHFRTSDVITNENMATEKGVCPAVLRWNNRRSV